MNTLEISPSLKLVGAILLATLVGLSQTSRNTTTGTPQQPATSSALEHAAKAIVKLDVRTATGDESLGSGVCVSGDGRIVTNLHVVKNAKRITVTLANGDKYDNVEIVDIDPRRDITILKIQAFSLQFAALYDSDTVAIGDSVFTVSNPLGLLTNSLSDGIVSGIRQMDGYRLFQTTAPISKGSSGGALLTKDGKLIGILVSTLSLGQNLNFAIPINYVRGMLDSTKRLPLSSLALEDYHPSDEASRESSKNESSPASEESPSDASSSRVLALINDERARLGEEAEKNGLPVAMRSRIGVWNYEVAKVIFGEALSHRNIYDSHGAVSQNSYMWEDPTKKFVKFELLFDSKTLLMTSAAFWPTPISVKSLGKDALKPFQTVKQPNGAKMHTNTDQKLAMFEDKTGNITMIVVFK